ncbi:hypothetical protein HKD37_09G025467 [Glycine soja]
MKNTISRPSLSKLRPNNPRNSSSPPTTTNGYHEPSLLAAEPPHEEEHFNRSKILRIHLKDLVENKLSILSFIVSLR